MVEVDDLHKCYGALEAVKGASLRVGRGEAHFVIGPSGCGKSTLVRLMAGLIQPDAGVVTFDGVEMTPAAARKLRQRIGFVVQDGGLFPHLTARGNVTLLARNLGWKADRIQT